MCFEVHGNFHQLPPPCSAGDSSWWSSPREAAALSCAGRETIPTPCQHGLFRRCSPSAGVGLWELLQRVVAAQVFSVLCFDPLLHEPNPLAPELLRQMDQFGCGTCPGLGVMGGTGGCAGEPSSECSSSHTLLPGSGTWHHRSREGPGVFIVLVNMHEWTR